MSLVHSMDEAAGVCLQNICQQAMSVLKACSRPLLPCFRLAVLLSVSTAFAGKFRQLGQDSECVQPSLPTG